MTENGLDLLLHLHQQELERMAQSPQARATSASSIPHTRLPEDSSGGRIAREWNFYRREVARLLSEGHEGKWVLIHGEQIIGMWDTPEQANQVRLEKYLLEDVMIHQVQREEPVLRGPTLLRKCPN
jgi:hypothetical protein